MGLKEQSRRVKRRVLKTLPISDKGPGRVILGAVIFALFVVVLWAGSFYLVDKNYFDVPSPMYIFVFTKIFFVILLLFIVLSSIYSTLDDKTKIMNDKT